MPGASQNQNSTQQVELFIAKRNKNTYQLLVVLVI